MTARVAWYAHHHGRGHLARAGAVIPEMASEVTVLSSAPAEGLDAVRLPLDTPGPGEPGPPPAPPGLHYAPLAAQGLRERKAQLAAFLASERPDLLVVDVSVEVALFARLCGVPVAYVRQHGDRTDAAHALAYSWSEELLAPFPEWLEDASAPESVRERTFYAGGFARSARAEPVPGRVAVLSGAGSEGFAAEQIEIAAAACPGTQWVVAGPGAWRDDPSALVASAEVVVSHAGHNAVMEVAAARRPLVCIPQRRPFDEQRGKADALRRAGAAVVRDSWPAAGEWPQVLAEARGIGGERLARAVDGRGAGRMAARIDALASAHARRGDLVLGRGAEDLETLGVPAHQA